MKEKCRFCHLKIHSKKCGKCKACCSTDKIAAECYHPTKTRLNKLKRGAQCQ